VLGDVAKTSVLGKTSDPAEQGADDDPDIVENTLPVGAGFP
jgi:hypothetical protein